MDETFEIIQEKGKTSAYSVIIINLIRQTIEKIFEMHIGENICFSLCDYASSSAKQIQPVWLCILSSRIFWENIWNKQKRKRAQAPKAGGCASEPNAAEGYWSCVSIGWIRLIELIGLILWIGWII